MPVESRSPLAPLQHPNFRLLWTATLASNLGSLVQGVGAAWAMAELTSSEGMVALVQASATMPVMALAVVAGALADNFDRRRVMLIAQCFMAVVSVGLAVVAWFGLLEPWNLLFFTFLLGLGAALHLPSWQASMRDLVPREDLAAAVALNSVSFNLMRSVGPALGGLIVAGLGPSAAFALNACSYLAVIYALSRWKHQADERSLPAERLGQAIFAGLRYVTLSPSLTRVMLRGFTFGFAAVAVMALLPILTRDQMGGGASAYGVMLGLFGTGAICGAFSTSFLRRFFKIEIIVRLSFAAFAVGSIWLSQAQSLIASIPGLTICGAAWVLALSHFNVSTQLATPRWVVGRALAIYQTMTFGGMALGAWFWGMVSELGSVPMALQAAGGAMFVGALIGLIWPMPDLNDSNLDPANRFTAPAPALDLRARSGPIQIMIDWHIPHERTNEFLELMAARRAVRRRDGARQWALLRDLENPDIWVESYHVATWVEYLRHNQRRTFADASSFDRLLELHAGPDKPHVHRMIERFTVPPRDDLPLLHPERDTHH